MSCDDIDDKEASGASIPVTPKWVPLQRNAPSLRRVSTEELIGPAGELLIVHQGREYRLRVTSKGKLILTA